MAKPHSKTSERKAKIHTAYYPSRVPGQGDRPIPKLNLKGHWLAAAGFDIGTPLKIRVMPGCLVLTAVEEDNELERYRAAWRSVRDNVTSEQSNLRE